jgi:regulation of enolase protein 1 (concanavalin A-like superfamily)
MMNGNVTSKKFAMLAVIAVLSAAPVLRAAEVEFRDDFDDPTLVQGWSIERSDPANHSLAERTGFFRINTQPGTIGEGSTIKNLLLRDFTGDFILETRMEFDPQTPQQFGGLIAYLDDTHAVAVGLVFVEGDRGTFRGVVMTSDGDGTDTDAPTPASRYDATNVTVPEVVYLRLLRKGDRFVGAFSPDGLVYKDIGTLINELPAAIRVGVGAANVAGTNCGQFCDISVQADFDFFQISRLGDEPPDDPSVEVTLESLTVTGPDEIAGGATGQFTATARFTDGTESDVSDESDWIVSPSTLGGIASGEFTPVQVSEVRQATVVATYAQLTSGGEVARNGSKAVRIIVAPPGGGGTVGCGAGIAFVLPVAIGLRLARSRRGWNFSLKSTRRGR